MEDVELLNRIREGDSDAYAPLVRRYQPDIVRFCASMLGNSTEAEDAAQEVFVKAYRALNSFRGDSAFLTWLHRIAANQCLDMLRKRTRQKTESWDALVEVEGDRLESLTGRFEDPVRMIENIELVKRVLTALSPDYRAILILREMQNLSYDEIAEALDCSLDAVKARLARARHDFLEKMRHFL